MKKRINVSDEKYKYPHIIEQYFNSASNEKFLCILKSLRKGYMEGYEYYGAVLPEEQMLDYNDVQVIDLIEKIKGIEFISGVEPEIIFSVPFLDMKFFFREACKKQIEFTPEHEEEIRYELAYIEELMDTYHANRMAYLAEHPEQA